MRKELKEIMEIERYLEGSMSESDKLAFESKMAVDSAFRDSVNNQELLVQRFSDLQFKQDIQLQHQRFTTAILANKIVAIFFVAVAGFFALYLGFTKEPIERSIQSMPKQELLEKADLGHIDEKLTIPIQKTATIQDTIPKLKVVEQKPESEIIELEFNPILLIDNPIDSLTFQKIPLHVSQDSIKQFQVPSSQKPISDIGEIKVYFDSLGRRQVDTLFIKEGDIPMISSNELKAIRPIFPLDSIPANLLLGWPSRNEINLQGLLKDGDQQHYFSMDTLGLQPSFEFDFSLISGRYSFRIISPSGEIVASEKETCGICLGGGSKYEGELDPEIGTWRIEIETSKFCRGKYTLDIKNYRKDNPFGREE